MNARNGKIAGKYNIHVNVEKMQRKKAEEVLQRDNTLGKNGTLSYA